MTIGQCSKDSWIIIWRLFINVVNWTWVSYIHIQYKLVFCVLILKVDTIHFEPSLVIVLKDLSACVCHTSSLTHDHHGLKYMNTLMNL
jgi:hypothetical protein